LRINIRGVKHYLQSILKWVSTKKIMDFHFFIIQTDFKLIMNRNGEKCKNGKIANVLFSIIIWKKNFFKKIFLRYSGGWHVKNAPKNVNSSSFLYYQTRKFK
jgi:hypothetical protein